MFKYGEGWFVWGLSILYYLLSSLLYYYYTNTNFTTVFVSSHTPGARSQGSIYHEDSSHKRTRNETNGRGKVCLSMDSKRHEIIYLLVI